MVTQSQDAPERSVLVCKIKIAPTPAQAFLEISVVSYHDDKVRHLQGLQTFPLKLDATPKFCISFQSTSIAQLPRLDGFCSSRPLLSDLRYALPDAFFTTSLCCVLTRQKRFTQKSAGRRCSRGILKNEQENLLDMEQPLPFMFLTEVLRPSTGPNNTEPGQVLCVCFFILVAKVINTNYRKFGA